MVVHRFSVEQFKGMGDDWHDDIQALANGLCAAWQGDYQFIVPEPHYRAANHSHRSKLESFGSHRFCHSGYFFVQY